MSTETYRYDFGAELSTEEIEASLLLAIWSCEALHGEAQVRLDAAHYFDLAKRACVIDAGTPVGRDINKLFIAFLRREYGPGDFRVRHLSSPPAPLATAA